jgi:2-C-methyl-D-erythritol 4-phosphate cytidylyltransferase
MPPKVSVLLPAAGSSTRYRGKRKKQFVDIDGRAVFLRTIEMFANRDDVCQVLLAIPADEEEMFHIKWSAKLTFFGIKVIIGAEARYETVCKMLAEVSDEAELVAIHDAVRPCVTTAQIDAVFKAADETGAAILARPLPGTIKRIADEQIVETVDRADLWEAQTPQVFKPEIIRKAYAQRDEVAESITDDAQLVEATGAAVTVVEGAANNIKITTGEDISIAGAILRSRPKPKPKGPTGPWAGEAQW